VSAGTLYVVATPIGNLGDLTARARRVLSEVGVVAAEDTRRARVLLGHIGSRARLVSYHAHSPATRRDALIARLERGEDVALVTDGGTPAVSDPGAELVATALARDLPVVSVPGPSAVHAALCVSGLSADRYTFLGFPPRRGVERQRILARVAESPWTSVVFESPVRLAALLRDLRDVCGAERRAVVARELTKVHEEARAGTLAELAVYYEEHPPRGEVTVVVAAAAPRPKSPPRREDAEQVAEALLADGLSRREAARRLAQECGIPRREAYRIVISL
jgi:16S rRNA (cytidine1402-2'-O)-methyltransferase